MNSQNIASYYPGSLIVQQLEGVMPGQSITTQPNRDDDETSRIVAIGGLTKETNDKIVIGCSSEGLPFNIVVNGGPGQRNDIFGFIDGNVTPLMNEYSKKLSECTSPEETNAITRDLIYKIYTARSKYPAQFEFAMSIAITYEQRGTLRCAGFGIGDTGLVLRKTNGEIRPLARSSYVVNGDTGAYTTDKVGGKFSQDYDHGIEAVDLIPEVNNILSRSEIFDVEVDRGDEIFGYTELHPSAFEDNPDHARVGGDSTIRNDKQSFRSGVASVVKPQLKPLQYHGSIFNNFRQYCDNDHSLKDFMISTLSVPAVDTQGALQVLTLAQEKAEFKRWFDSLHPEMDKDIYTEAKDVKEALRALDKETDITKLTRAYAACNRAARGLDNNDKEESAKALMDIAAVSEGAPSFKWKLAGAAMMAFGTVLAIVGGLILTGSLGVTATGAFAIPGTLGVGLGAGLMGFGVLAAVSGMGMFAYGCQRSASKAMYNLADKCNEKHEAYRKNK